MRITGTSEDTYLNELCQVAERRVENFCKRAIINQTWKLEFDRWPSDYKAAPLWHGTIQGPESMIAGEPDVVRVPRPPLVSVESIKTFDEDNAESTYSTSNYQVDTVSDPGRVYLNKGAIWPTVLRERNAIQVNFTAGYGANKAEVESAGGNDLVHAVATEVAYLYENRGDCGEIISPVAKSLLLPYVVRDV